MKADLLLCNLTSRGMTLSEARAHLAAEEAKRAERAGRIQAPSEPEKISAKDKKEALAAEIEALGGEVPGANSSVAKFEEALTAAKFAAEEASEEADELM